MTRIRRSDVLESLPHGLIRSVGRTLELHVGEDRRISKPDILEALAQLGFKKVDDRKLRAAIHELRQSGVPILASSGSSGYWLASSRAELDHFIDSELRPRATDLFKTISALESAAAESLGPSRAPANQGLLFDVARN